MSWLLNSICEPPTSWQLVADRELTQLELTANCLVPTANESLLVLAQSVFVSVSQWVSQFNDFDNDL